MSVLAVEPARLRRTVPERWWALARLLLLLGVLAWAGLVCVIGVRPSTVADLRAGVESGQIDEVEATPGLSPGSRGRYVVRVTWRDGLLRHSAELVEHRSGAVSERLLAMAPDLRIREAGAVESSAESAGFVLPDWTLLLSLGLSLATLLAIRWGPPPSCATRWAWFWLVASGPIGLAAYLLLAGGLPGPRHPRVRQHLTGGWGFLLALVLGGVWGW